MIDIVIPYRLMNEGVELKYALRSAEKYLAGIGNVFIVGEKPDWLQEVIHISMKDGNMMAGRERNIYNKVLAAANDPRVSDYFLYMNDDHFLLEYFEAGEFPPFWFNTLDSSWEANDTPYKQTLLNTMGVLPMGGMERNFDGHCPMLFNRERFVRTFEPVDWSQDYGYCMKTIYCVLNGIEGDYMRDMKISHATLPNELNKLLSSDSRPYFSIGDKALNTTMDIALSCLYPQKSKYEK